MVFRILILWSRWQLRWGITFGTDEIRDNIRRGSDEKDESAEKKYTSAEVTEMMYSMEEIRKQQQRQDKIAGYLAIPVMLIVAAIFKLSGHANFGGAVFAGLLGAGAIVCVYYLWENREDKESRKVYGFLQLL